MTLPRLLRTQASVALNITRSLWHSGPSLSSQSKPPVAHLPPNASVLSLSKVLHSEPARVESALKKLGVKVSSEQDIVPDDAAEVAAIELGFSAERSSTNECAQLGVQPRSAVACVLGHVDHGKTTLLDALRKASVAEGEAGGITQHVGAFVARMSSAGSITFLDTPGHAAFDLMRARGTSITDLAVLVVAADDSVQEQTREALAHVRRTSTPFVVAITKCDKEGAQPDVVQNDLIAEGVELEQAGGNVQTINVSAKTREGFEELEEALLLQADTLDLNAPVDGRVRADIVDSRIDKGLGPYATVVVKSGTLHVGSFVAAGHEWGRVRALRVEGNQQAKEAGPGEPADVIGLRGAPDAGEELLTCESEASAKRIAEVRAERKHEARQGHLAQQAVARGVPGASMGITSASSSSFSTLSLESTSQNRLVIVVKGDTQGSVEAAKNAMEELSTDIVPVEVVHTGVGAISGSDIELARSVGGMIVGFGVKAGQGAQKEARTKAVTVQTSNVIYKLLETVSDNVLQLAPTRTVEDEVGVAEVLQVFEIKQKRGNQKKIAGCRIKRGSVRRSGKYRVQRGNRSASGDNLLSCSSLKRHKLDVNQVGTDTECGIALEGFEDFQPGDLIMCVEERKEKLPSEKTAAGGTRVVGNEGDGSGEDTRKERIGRATRR